MAQGLGFIEFSTGDVLSAAAANGYLASQTVMVFADAAARTAAITTPYEGMMSYLKDTNATEYYSGSAWVALGGSSNSMTLLSTTAITATNSITVSSISGAYTNLVIFIENWALSSTDNIQMRLNGDTGSNYNPAQVQGQQGVINNTGAQTGFGAVQYSNVNGTNNASVVVTIPFYSTTAAYKTLTYQLSATYGGTSSPVAVNGAVAYRSTSAITSFTLNAGVNFLAQGNIKIYGVK